MLKTEGVLHFTIPVKNLDRNGEMQNAFGLDHAYPLHASTKMPPATASGADVSTSAQTGLRGG